MTLANAMFESEEGTFQITRRIVVGDVTATTSAKKGFHEAALEVIGKDYQHVHWNEKAEGVSYDYQTGSSMHTITITAEPRPDREAAVAESEPM